MQPKTQLKSSFGRFLTIFCLSMVFSFSLATPSVSAKKETKKVESKKDKKPSFRFQDWIHVKGLYTIWALNQHGFLLGKDHPLDDADYVVQMLRARVRLGDKKLGVVTRFDAAQGWWGVNNNPNVERTATSVDKDGKITSSSVYNPYKLFRNKDTNFLIHFDWAYFYIEVPWIPVKTKIQAGRQNFKVGNRLVLDQDYDGVQVFIKPTKSFQVDLLWARVAEGDGSFKNPVGLLMNDDGARGESNLFGGRVWYKSRAITAEVFGLYYGDNSGASGRSYLPNGVGYLRNRFVPNLSNVLAVGLSLKGKIGVLKGLSYKFEFDYLMGEDKVANKDHAGNLLDINDGTLSGYNVYLNIIQKMKVGIPVDLGVTFGMGSGDGDLTGGSGNINKIQTMGFFPLTNVWEDSVMPDVGGISPQGLGSPVSRGYREFENTIAAQFKAGAMLTSFVRLEASYTYLRSTQPIFAWNANGPIKDKSSNDIGSEVDVNLIIKLYGGRFLYKALFGVFMPGQGAAYLINGNDSNMETVWELKQVFVARF